MFVHGDDPVLLEVTPLRGHDVTVTDHSMQGRGKSECLGRCGQGGVVFRREGMKRGGGGNAEHSKASRAVHRSLF